MPTSNDLHAANSVAAGEQMRSASLLEAPLCYVFPFLTLFGLNIRAKLQLSCASMAIDLMNVLRMSER